MPSQKAQQILKSRTDLTDARIASLSESEAWKCIYELDNAEKQTRLQKAEQICFTGFGATARTKLESEARSVGFDVKESVTTTLSYLCKGPNAGPSKLVKAEKLGVPVLSEEHFLQLIRSRVNA